MAARKRQTTSPSEKKCITCHAQKPIEGFGILRKNIDGRRNQCQKCRTEYRRSKDGSSPRRRLDGNYDARECRACSVIKCMSEFYINKASNDGRSLICKTCSSRRKKQTTVLSGGKTITMHKKDDTKRKCTICGLVKPLDEFTRAKQTRDGRTSECKLCKAKKTKERTEPTERQEAIGFLNWFGDKFPNVFIFHIPNGMKRSISVARRLKEEGVKRGVPDYFIPEWNLWIEMKRKTKGSLSKDQKNVIQILENVGHTVIVGKGAQDASAQILDFLENKYLQNKD